MGGGSSRAVENSLRDAGEEIKEGTEKVVKPIYKGIKRMAQPVIKGVKRALGVLGTGLEAPAKWVQKHDPLAKKMGKYGYLSPITLGSSMITAPMTMGSTAAKLASGDEGLKKKLRTGDPDAITDVMTLPLGLFPIGKSLGRIAKKGTKVGIGARTISKIAK